MEHPVKTEPCEYCDFIGPFVSAEQPVRELHRAWHDFSRTAERAFGPLIEWFYRVSAAAREAEKSSYALTATIEDADETAAREAEAREAASAEAREMRRMGYGNVYAPHEDPRLHDDPTEETTTP